MGNLRILSPGWRSCSRIVGPLLFLLLIGAAVGTESHTHKFSDDEGPIRVGVFVDLTGQTTSFGVSTRNGIQMAAEEINQAGGIDGRKIQLIVRDDEGEPGKAATAVARLIKEHKVHAVLGEVTSSSTIAAAVQAQEAQVPMITPSATNPRVTQIGDYIFRTCFIDPLQGTAMAKFAFSTLRAKRAAIMYDTNSDYSQSMVKTFEARFAQLGGTVRTKQGFQNRDRDYSEQWNEVRAAKPDVVYIAGYYQEAGVIAVNARQMGITQPLLGGDGWDSPLLWELGGKALNDSYMSQHFSTDDPSPAVQDFVANYRNKYQDSPDALAALGYDAMMVLAHAIKSAGTTNKSKLRDAIAQTRDFPGVTGPITIDAGRNAIKPVIIQRLSDGKFVYEETIWPDSIEHH